MIFDSLTFVLFFIAVLLAYAFLGGWRFKKAMLLVASYVFYMAWNPALVVLLLLSTVVDWFAARAMVSREDARGRFLLVSLMTNLGLLAFFKYSMFAASSGHWMLTNLGFAVPEPTFSIILPMGISFYTFQTLSYSIDIYRGTLKPAKSFLDFALFVSFFPQLVAGPIVRAADFLPQLEEPKQVGRDALGWGLFLMLLGLFQKIVVADTLLAPIVDLVYQAQGPVGLADAWVGTLAFAGQILCDFAGYSTCAIGAGLCLGFKLPDNFKFPYAARGFSDFWRRWHISLSTWLRDYLYISLGGNRKGPVRTYINLSLTMLLGGLWHGASWAFVVWGMLHGLYLVVERLLTPWIEAATWLHNAFGRFLAWGLTFVAVCYAWVFFRARTFERAWEVVQGMSLVGAPATKTIMTSSNIALTLVVLGCILGTHQYMRERTLHQVVTRMPWPLIAAAMVFMAFLIATSAGNERAFIYFQF